MNAKRGLLIVNLGTPSNSSPFAIKRYLSEFLQDRHVVDLPKILWYPILHWLILPKRIKTLSSHYQSIWLNDKSPLLYYCERLVKNIQDNNPDLMCALAMNYGQPDLQSALQQLQSCSQIDVLCLYPQHSTTTTQAVIDKVKNMTDKKIFPPIRYFPDYAEHQAYIDALISQIHLHFKAYRQPDVLLLSYHGIPVSYIKKREDNYVKRCQITSQLLINQLSQHYPSVNIQISYQSRFGKGEWTTPATNHVLLELAKQKKSVAVICPGFAVDCLETLYEIAKENKTDYLVAGGTDFSYIPALNDSSLQTALIQSLIDDNTLAEQ